MLLSILNLSSLALHASRQVLTYAGPDTANKKVFVNAVGKAEPPSASPPPPPPNGGKEGGGGGGGEGGGECPSQLCNKGKSGLNDKCAQYRDKKATLAASKAKELFADCMAADCVQSLENGGGHGNCRFMDTNGFCYSASSAQKFCAGMSLFISLLDLVLVCESSTEYLTLSPCCREQGK